MGFFLSPGEREYVRQVNRTPGIRRANRHMLAIFLYIFGVLSLMSAFLSPSFTGWIWQSAAGEASPAHDLLTGYLRWYWLLLIFSGGSFGLSAVLLVFYLCRAIRNWVKACGVWRDEVLPKLAEIDNWDRAGQKEEEYSRGRVMAYGSRFHSAALSYFVCGFLCFLIVLGSGGMLAQEDLAKLPFQAREDLSQIEAGFLQTAEVWISPNCRPARLPGPYGEGQPELTTLYGVISEDTEFQWVRVYVPHALGFSVDQSRLFDEEKTLGWNWEHARRYQVRYTSGLHVAVELAPIP